MTLPHAAETGNCETLIEQRRLPNSGFRNCLCAENLKENHSLSSVKSIHSSS